MSQLKKFAHRPFVRAPIIFLLLQMKIRTTMRGGAMMPLRAAEYTSAFIGLITPMKFSAKPATR